MLAKIKKETKRRIYIIPVSISYEKLKEIESYEQEIKNGKDKIKEKFNKLTSIKTKDGKLLKIPSENTQPNLFYGSLMDVLDSKDSLIVLADTIKWEIF